MDEFASNPADRACASGDDHLLSDMPVTNDDRYALFEAIDIRGFDPLVLVA